MRGTGRGRARDPCVCAQTRVSHARMSVVSFSHYNLRAPRELLDTLRAFYVEAVGLKPGPRPPFTRFGYWLYAGEQAVLHLSCLLYTSTSPPPNNRWRSP